MKGKVKRFNSIKGYGFITTEDGRDAFFHFSSIIVDGYKTIDEGAEVECELVDSERGLQATNIKEIKKEG